MTDTNQATLQTTEPANEQEKAVLSVESLEKSFGDAMVLKDISFEVHPGEVDVYKRQGGKTRRETSNSPYFIRTMPEQSQHQDPAAGYLDAAEHVHAHAPDEVGRRERDVYKRQPMGGYTAMVEKMFGDTEILLNTEFRTFIEEHSGIADRIIYCGPIDEYFDYKLGNLEYRSLRFETESVDSANWQGNAVVNYTEREIPFTRIIEHKHFEFGDQPTSILSLIHI